jgi:hypothetical protein
MPDRLPLLIVEQPLSPFKACAALLVSTLDKEKDMRDYLPLQSNHNLPDLEPEEDQEEQQPVVVDFVYNTHEDGKGRTIALKLSLQLPVKSLGYPHSQ